MFQGFWQLLHCISVHLRLPLSKHHKQCYDNKARTALSSCQKGRRALPSLTRSSCLSRAIPQHAPAGHQAPLPGWAQCHQLLCQMLDGLMFNCWGFLHHFSLRGEKGEKPGGQHPILQTYTKTSAAKHSIRGKPHLLMLMQLTPMKSQGTHFCGYRGPFALNSSSHPSAHSKMGKQLFTCAIIQIFAHDNFSLLLSGSFRITIATKWISTILLNKVFEQNPFWPVNTRKDWYNRAECIQTSLDWLAFAMASCVKRSWTKMRIAWGETFKDQSN